MDARDARDARDRLDRAPDQGGRQLAGRILDAVAGGHHDQVADLIAPLDAVQLRSLVTVLATQVDQTMPEAPATGPAALCELAINTAAPMFDTTPQAILSADRSRTVSDARAVAMSAARQAGLSLPAIAEQFNKDHGSVLHAVRRTADRTRLAVAAAKVSEHINSRYAATLPRADQDTNMAPLPHTPAANGPIERAVGAAAKAFRTTPDVILGSDRTRRAAAARAVAMTAARMHGHSLPTIARHFDRDHTTVLHATRRIEKSPQLRELAEKIAADLPRDEAGTGTWGHGEVAQEAPPGATANGPTTIRSAGLREQQRAAPSPASRTSLSVAR